MSASNPSGEQYVQARAPFLRYLVEQAAARRPASLAGIIAGAGSPDNVAVVAVDVVNGFCVSGALASPRVGAIVPPLVDLFTRAHAAGVRRLALVREDHTAHAEEFRQFAPHCIAGTDEAEPVDELKRLPFYAMFHVIRKNSISPWYSPDDLADWLGLGRPDGVRAVIVMGDCTDLCVHQFALPLKLAANQADLPMRVVAPVDTIQTYDLPVEVAAAVGAMPHDGDLLHDIFLYHLVLTGMEVVSHVGA